MKYNKYWRLLFLLPLICFFVSCSDSDDVGDSYKTFEGETIKDFLDNNPDYSEFRTALDTVNVLPLMSSYGKYTCFVPTNEAIERYVKENGFSSFSDFLDSAEAVRQMVYFQIIDGESNGVGTYLTTSFTNGNIATKNMAGRYVYTMLSDDGTTWIVNKSSRITSSDNILVNGVAHVVDNVVEGNQQLLSDYILNSSAYTLYAEALKATGLVDSLNKIEDDSYVQPSGMESTTPTQRLYGYTALLEPDSVLALNGINSLQDMRNYAEEKYPDGAGKSDTDRESSLHMFVAYHLLPYKLTSSELCPTLDYTVTQTFEDPDWQLATFRDGRFRLDNYLFPMAPNTVIYVQKFVWRDQVEQTPIFNDNRNPYDSKYINMIKEEPNVITIDLGKSNIDCLNGEIHSLTGMLYYREDIFHHRLRMDFTGFLPELWNNGVLTKKCYLPLNYCDNLKVDKDNVTVYYTYRYGGHSYFQGNMFMVKGRCNLDLEIGPIPSGSYEVRIGYQVQTQAYGVVQYYLDGEPCGIPLDQTKTANNPEIGWIQSWQYMEKYPQTSWISGKETPDDYYGYNNDKTMHNLGYMKGADSYASTECAHGDYSPVNICTARNDIYAIRRVLGFVTWSDTQKHVLRISNLMDKSFQLDYIEFIPKDLIEDEDTH
ncbi:MAG: fasciclin domain-containing protein [Prevotella sp.]|jgi:hypothetical protein